MVPVVVEILLGVEHLKGVAVVKKMVAVTVVETKIVWVRLAGMWTQLE